eukprot:scaffold8007_cov78-Isochrysis_galbana.AAC.1
MPSTGSHLHPGPRPGAGGAAATLTRRHPRRQPLPTPSNRAPCRKQRRRRTPAPTGTLVSALGLGPGYSLYPPPPAWPAAPHVSKTRLSASSSAAVAIGNLRHAPAGKKTGDRAIHRLPPAPRPLPWGWGRGCHLDPPPLAPPAAPHAFKSRPPPQAAPPWPTRAGRNKTRAYAAHLLPPAPQALPWGWGRGCSLYPPPPARPAALHASKSRLPASSSAAVAIIGHLHHAPAAKYRASVVSTGCNWHAQLRAT